MRLTISTGIIVLGLLPITTHAAESTVQIIPKNGVIEFQVNNEIVTKYHIAPTVAKPYLWPLLSPAGVPVTRAWPMEKGTKGETTDHVHQKSAWFCHGDIIAEGITTKSKIPHIEGIDFWSETPGHGVIACVDVSSPMIKGNHGSIVTRNDWKTAEGVKVLSEVRTLHLHALASGPLIEIESTLTADVTPITFGDTKEGSFGVRVNDAIAVKPGGGQFTNAKGDVGEPAIWGKPAAWCDYVGKVGGKQAGIAVFADPKNTFESNWHARGYGLMAANPFGRAKSGFPSQKDKTELVKLKKGESLTLRYGIYVHDGDTKAGDVAGAFQAFSGK